MIVYLEKKATKKDILMAAEEFEDYIKIVVDIERKVMAMGGKLHADSENILIKNGSRQRNIWGGGFDLMEILNPEIRKKFIKTAKRFLI